MKNVLGLILMIIILSSLANSSIAYVDKHLYDDEIVLKLDDLQVEKQILAYKGNYVRAVPQKYIYLNNYNIELNFYSGEYVRSVPDCNTNFNRYNKNVLTFKDLPKIIPLNI